MILATTPHFRKLFADDLLTYLESMTTGKSDFQPIRKFAMKKLDDPQPEVLNPNSLIKDPGDRRFPLANELWPLVNDYHRHFQNIAVAREMKFRLEERNIRLELEKSAWIKRRMILVELIENTILELILKNKLKLRDIYENQSLSQNQLRRTRIAQLKNTLLERAQKAPAEFRKVLNDVLDDTIRLPNEQPKLKIIAKKNFKILDIKQQYNELLRILIENRIGEQFEDMKELLAAYEMSAKYTLVTSFTNPSAIYLKAPKSGQPDIAIKKVIGIKYKK